MNFYISSSKTFIIILISLFLLLDMGLNFLFKSYIDAQTSSKRFTQQKESKIRHLVYNNHHPKDYIFIGSSRTLYHISTHSFLEKGIDIYNLGISATGISHHVYMVNNILKLKHKPRNVVISFPVNSLYSKDQHVGPYIGNTIDDFLYALSSKDLSVIYNTYVGMLKNPILSAESQYLIKQKLDKIQNQHMTKDTTISHEDDTYFKTDCKPFSYENISKTVLLCTNGDGIINKTYTGNIKRNKVTLENYNQNYLLYLKKLTYSLSTNNINPIIILEPTLTHDYSFDLNSIQNELATSTIINLSAIQLATNLWADTRHLNKLGREEYSELLIKRLTQDP